FVSVMERKVMILLQSELIRSANEWSFIISLVIAGLFYQQYRECERAIKKEEMLDKFLKDD
ncbi:MAG: hypothetical protein C4329_13030, partial [Chitinophagaceae bacterium]